MEVVYDIDVGAGKFSGLLRIFAGIFSNFTERFLCDFAYRFSHKDHEGLFSV